jgi:hypothetical protein
MRWVRIRQKSDGNGNFMGLDGDVPVGTVERAAFERGWTATYEETGETKWFKHRQSAMDWLQDKRTDELQANALEQELSVRFEWQGYDF